MQKEWSPSRECNPTSADIYNPTENLVIKEEPITHDDIIGDESHHSNLQLMQIYVDNSSIMGELQSDSQSPLLQEPGFVLDDQKMLDASVLSRQEHVEMSLRDLIIPNITDVSLPSEVVASSNTLCFTSNAVTLAPSDDSSTLQVATSPAIASTSNATNVLSQLTSERDFQQNRIPVLTTTTNNILKPQRKVTIRSIQRMPTNDPRKILPTIAKAAVASKMCQTVDDAAASSENSASAENTSPALATSSSTLTISNADASASVSEPHTSRVRIL